MNQLTYPNENDVMQSWTHSLLRKRRIIGRIINGKVLPAFTYRWDSRDIELIRNIGFQPWNPQGNITPIEHVTGVCTRNHNTAKMSKYVSQWVSTGAYGMLKRLDPTFAQQVLNTNLYRIDTKIACLTGNFIDVNDIFDRAGMLRPYATQREWLKEGGIPGQAIVAYMTGKTFMDQYDFKNGAPHEDLLKGWLDP